MEPKPVITYFGDMDLIGSVLQKKLQTRLKALQFSSLKDDSPYTAFSSACNGVEFLPLHTAKPPQALHRRPALHTFWTASCDMESYRKHDLPMINSWLSEVEKFGGAECLIVYCITAAVRAKRHRTMTFTGTVDEKIMNEFKGRVDDLIQLRLASSDEARVLESYTAFVTRVNGMCLAKFRRDTEKEAESVARRKKKRIEPEEFYPLFLQKLNLAVVYEMTLQHEEALTMYSEANTDLEEALSMYADAPRPPEWLEKIRKSECTSWDYPKLVWDQLSWRYLLPILGCTSPLLHTRTFLLVRIAHLHFLLDKAWTISELAIATLHCMAREIKLLKLNLPAGAFDCWAYMTCNEAVLAIMTQISPDSLVTATSSLLLVRAELWHYALQKLHDIGILCGVMPSSNKLNYDGVLVKQITAGITPVPFEVGPKEVMEDEGKKLIEIITSRQAFQQAYLVLGEMVVGAFKHAGRRRVAFKVGTMMAQFHRDLGLVQEAEEFLSDICKFYFKDQWTQLSTKAYSLLADCQMKLKMEEKHISTMLLLASLPPYPGAAHDPSQWLDRLMDIAKKSPYQKILTWDPLLELVVIRQVGGGERGYCTGEKVEMEIVVKYHGPKEMLPIIATLSLRTKQQELKQQLKKSPPSPPGPSPAASLENLEELDLESDGSQLPNSRQIGVSSHFRSTAAAVTHISRGDMAEMDSGFGEDRVKVPEFQLITMKVILQPGENKIRLVGEGEYLPHKVSLKCGSLDFLITIPHDSPHRHTVAVVPPRVELDVAVTSRLGVFLSSYDHSCSLTLRTGADTSVPDNAPIRLISSSSIQCSIVDADTTITMEETSEGVTETAFHLPAIAENSEHVVPLSLVFPLLRSTSSPEGESADQSNAFAWKHEMQLYCDWLSPVHVAKIPVTVYEPLTITHTEHSAGENTFLQLLVENTCPVPLSLGESMLAADLELTRLHGELPKILYPGDSYSCVWQVRPGTPTVGERTQGSLHIKYKPLIGGQETQFKHNFVLSSMQTIYEIRTFVDPPKDHTMVTATRSAILRFTIKNIAKEPKDNKRCHLPSKLSYDIMAISDQWSFQDETHGVIKAPKFGETIQLCLKVVPNMHGPLSFPTLTLCECLEKDGKTKGLNVKQEHVPLSSAQVYDVSCGEVINIYTLQQASNSSYV